MAENMMLSKTYSESKVVYPVYISEKLDGVPGIYTITTDGIEVMSRQGKPILSTEHIKKELKLLNLPVGTKVIGEHYINRKPFKYISGKTRQHEACEELSLCIFDVIQDENDMFAVRWDNLCKHLSNQVILDNLVNGTISHISVLPQIRCYNKTEVNIAKIKILQSADKHGRVVEGFMYRNGIGPYTYTRSWNCMKEVIEHTIDLQVFGVIEASDKDGNAMKMAGTLKCKDSKGKIYNVSPGKSTHTERKVWWENPATILDKIIVVKYKPDDTYEDGLRQPTFQHIHEDKTEPD